MASFNVYGTSWEPDEPYEVSIARIKALAAAAGTPGHNEYGQALHACHGYRHDAHYWAWITSGRKNG